MEKKIKELDDHYIICGYGRMGKIIARELKNEKVKLVAIEKTPTVHAKEEAFVITGDATQDDFLKEVGIERARGLITVLPSDAENIYVVEDVTWLSVSIPDSPSRFRAPSSRETSCGTRAR